MLNQRIVSILFSLAMVFAGANCAAIESDTSRGDWVTTLQARDINNDGVVDAFFDQRQNITWLADWGAAGALSQEHAAAWAGALNIFGVSGWRLPSLSSVEYQTLYSVTLGSLSQDQGGAGANSGPFIGMATSYWAGDSYSGPGYPAGTPAGYVWSMTGGFPTDMSSSNLFNAVAVRNGDVSAVPEPLSSSMFLLGLPILLAATRRNRLKK